MPDSVDDRAILNWLLTHYLTDIGKQLEHLGKSNFKNSAESVLSLQVDVLKCLDEDTELGKIASPRRYSFVFP